MRALAQDRAPPVVSAGYRPSPAAGADTCTPEERNKERARKAGTNEPTKVESKGKKDKKDMLSDLKKGGVKVIGSKGEMKDVEGNKVKTGDVGTQGASRYKL